MASFGQRLGHLVKSQAGSRHALLIVRSLSGILKNETIFQSSDMADAYAKFRPEYGSELLETIVSFCKETSPTTPFSLALDVGCGSGQSTTLLTRTFRKVVGLDVSEAQISRAPTSLPNVSFRVGPAEDLSFVDSGSVDLVTVAAALHWLDTGRFYAEVERVLKPGGALVAYCYNKPTVDEPQAQEILDHLYGVVLRHYWSNAVLTHVDRRYCMLALPFPEWRRNDDLRVEKCCTVDGLVGYLRSLSSYDTYLKEHPTTTVLSDVKRRLKRVYQDQDGAERPVQVMWSIFMLMGHKPQTSCDQHLARE